MDSFTCKLKCFEWATKSYVKSWHLKCMHSCIPKESSWVEYSTTKSYSKSLPPPNGGYTVSNQNWMAFSFPFWCGDITVNIIKYTCTILHKRCIEMVITLKCIRHQTAQYNLWFVCRICCKQWSIDNACKVCIANRRMHNVIYMILVGM